MPWCGAFPCMIYAVLEWLGGRIFIGVAFGVGGVFGWLCLLCDTCCQAWQERAHSDVTMFAARDTGDRLDESGGNGLIGSWEM